MAWMVSVVLVAVLRTAGPAVDLGADVARGLLVSALEEPGSARPGLELVLALGTLEELLGDRAGAEDLYEHALLAFADDPMLLHALVRVHAWDGQWREARRLTDLLIDHADFRARALLWRALVHEALGEEEQAERATERALDELDVVLTDRARAQRFLADARALIAAGRAGRPPAGSSQDDESSPAALRAELQAARQRR